LRASIGWIHAERVLHHSSIGESCDPSSPANRYLILPLSEVLKATPPITACALAGVSCEVSLNTLVRGSGMSRLAGGLAMLLLARSSKLSFERGVARECTPRTA